MVGGKKGFNSVLALIFTFAVVVMMYIPMMYIGVSPFIAATLWQIFRRNQLALCLAQ